MGRLASKASLSDSIEYLRELAASDHPCEDCDPIFAEVYEKAKQAEATNARLLAVLCETCKEKAKAVKAAYRVHHVEGAVVSERVVLC